MCQKSAFQCQLTCLYIFYTVNPCEHSVDTYFSNSATHFWGSSQVNFYLVALALGSPSNKECIIFGIREAMNWQIRPPQGRVIFNEWKSCGCMQRFGVHWPHISVHNCISCISSHTLESCFNSSDAVKISNTHRAFFHNVQGISSAVACKLVCSCSPCVGSMWDGGCILFFFVI